jgi:hypothetical protein
MFPVNPFPSPHVLNSSVQEIDHLEASAESLVYFSPGATFKNEENTPQSKTSPNEVLKLKKATSMVP